MSFGSVSFRASRMNPINGLRNLVNRQALLRLGMATVKLTILAFVTWSVLSPRVPKLLAVSDSGVGEIASTALSAIFDLGLALAFLMIVVGLTDFVLQRRRARNALKMTKEEVRQEGKDQEGNPQVRMALRRRARQLAMSRMMAAVPTADVVVVNPIRLAIALRYDQQTMRAPTIVAKGQRLMAARIRDIAKANRVPIIEDVPLARALFTRPLGSEAPAHLYRAIARILVLVHQARFGRRPAPATGQPGTRSNGTPADPSTNPLFNRRLEPPDYPIQGADR
jgi:flagellar biosynthetic protein FlhB